MEVAELPATIARRVSVTETCWEWLGWRNSGGYGYVHWQGRDRPVHRVVMEVLGRVEPHQDVDHLCRNRRCVNPDHLEGVSRLENVRRGLIPGLWPKCKRGHDLTIPGARYRAPSGLSSQCHICKNAADRSRYHRLARTVG